MKQEITEEMGLHKEWYEEAKKTNLGELPAFLDRLLNGYRHDYGTICHALAAGGIATMWAMNRHEQGGITGFQAGAIMWQVIREWNYSHNKCGLRLINYDNMLYPQYMKDFQKTISPSIWEAIQKQAALNINEANQQHQEYLVKKEQYQADLAKFVEKYPDYLENRKHYDRLGSGTAAEWEAEHTKEASGFEFAPEEPYEPIFTESPVYQHWQSIVNGLVPFGYRIADD